MSIHNAHVLTRHTPSPPEQRVLTFSHGTRVTVRDLFGSMPVRVKHRALQAEKSSFSREWDWLLLDLVALLLARPDSACVSIRDASNRQTTILKTGSQPRSWLADGCRLLHQASLCGSPDSSNWIAIGASSPTLSIAGYVCREPVATKRVQFISLGIEPLSNEYRCNILYEEVNKVFADSSFGVIEDDSGSDDTPRKLDGFTNKQLKARKGVDRWPMFFLKMSPTSPTLQRLVQIDDMLDGHQPNLALITDLLKAMFYEFLKKNHCRPRKVHLSTKPKLLRPSYRNTSPGSNDVTGKSMLSTVPGPSIASAGELVQELSHCEKSDSLPDPTFASWSRIKAGQQLQTFQKAAAPRSGTQSTSTTPTQISGNSTPGRGSTGRSRPTTPAEPSRSPLYDANGKLMRKPFEDTSLSESSSRAAIRPVEPGSEEHSSQSWNHELQDEMFEWINPATKMATTINARTGFSMAPKPLTLSRRVSKAKSKGASSDSEAKNHGTRTPWTRDLFSEWNNPVFESAEAPIPKLPDMLETLGLDPRPGGHHCHHGKVAVVLDTRYETSVMGLQGRLSKDTLRRAQLISQVDKKFIFARLPFDRLKEDKEGTITRPGPSSVLVLIDQHAADERCRVEALMKDYFKPATYKDGSQFWGAVTEVLPKPVQFELSSLDEDVLGRFQQYFSYWGICYDIEVSAPAGHRDEGRLKKRSHDTKAKASVRSLPPAILERCRTEPRLLVELLRKEAWRLNDEAMSVSQPKIMPVSEQAVDSDVPVWVSLFHGCPQGIVELINSRSCRSTSTLDLNMFCAAIPLLC